MQVPYILLSNTKLHKLKHHFYVTILHLDIMRINYYYFKYVKNGTITSL